MLPRPFLFSGCAEIRIKLLTLSRILCGAFSLVRFTTRRGSVRFRERSGMKILLSAYACEPNKGSEPGVGWNWTLALARRGYEVHVITRSNNRPNIEGAHEPLKSRVAFHYHDLPHWARFWKYWPGGIYLYYLLWQIGAYRLAKVLHSSEQFELVHHITFVSHRQPSFMGNLGIPFIFGPVGGGETMPRQLRKSIPWSARIAEFLRDVGSRLVAIDPLMRRTYSRAHVIACATEETLKAIPLRFRSKCMVQRAIGIDGYPKSQPAVVEGSDQYEPHFLFVGRLLYWKGLNLALHALVRVRKEIPDVKLRVIGEGSDSRWLAQVAERAKIADAVEWIPRKPQTELEAEYRRNIGFVFPSLHDSGGMVVIEALAAGSPVICLNLGGPGSIVNASCGFALQVGGKTEATVIEELALAMISLAREPGLRRRFSQGAVQRASEVTWDAAAEAIYSLPFIAALGCCDPK